MVGTALITNDDGVEAPGLRALATAALAAGLRVTVAAPLTDASGTGASLRAAESHRRVVTREVDLDGLPALGVGAHPGLIALAGCQGAFGERPDVLLSGINRGANLGRALLHSGTAGAALTASVAGIRAAAFSLDVWPARGTVEHWETVASLVPEVLDLLRDCPPGTVFNVNVPNVPTAHLPTLKWADLSEFGSVRSSVTRLDDGAIGVTTVAGDAEPAPGTDAALLAAGHPTITPIRSVAEDPRIDRAPFTR
ncbi:5'/3'-nucleotidase SurE [Actinokineospora auranticolor]|uniref:5'-nucleotidase n=1 Tax=Actinokineospora auranticolor TaxID=155976 RepID=A0A2S6GM76_9PSEU|nr:5'/3'-nucleotidase SurE [Actinokineospora auranticolor]PPK66325.1 5'-nucleotidase [Actinokineospora auranticolor]